MSVLGFDIRDYTDPQRILEESLRQPQQSPGDFVTARFLQLRRHRCSRNLQPGASNG